MARLYNAEEVISCWDIPLPEEEKLSDDDFDGYMVKRTMTVAATVMVTMVEMVTVVEW